MKKILKYAFIVIVPFWIPLYLLSKGYDKLQWELISEEELEKRDLDNFIIWFLWWGITLATIIIITFIFFTL